MPKLWACYEPDLIQYHEDRNAAVKISSEDVKAFFGLSASEAEEEILSISGGVASIAISGVLTQAGPDMVDKIFGIAGTSYQAIIESIAIAEEHPDVDSIELIMDTPGGEVSGVDGVYQAISGAEKPVTAVNAGLMASAGYWIASAADSIVAESAVAETGSIGVIVTGADFSEAYEKEGIKVVRIVSENAPNKAPRVDNEAGIEEIRNRINAVERVFISRVAMGRGISEETVKTDFGRGSVLIAQDPDPTIPDAISVGMLDNLLYNPKGLQVHSKPTSAAESALEDSSISKGANMDEKQIAAMLEELENLKADHAAISARVERATPYLTGTDYPAAIQALAVRVLSGDAEPAVLEGAIVALDAMREGQVAIAAAVETDAIPEVNAQSVDAPTVSDDGIIRNELDQKAAVARSRSNLGIVR